MTTARILVTGSRDWTDLPRLESVLDRTVARIMYFGNWDNVVIVHGACATGADAMADAWAKRKGLPVEPHPVTPNQWKIEGRAAGPNRNKRMVSLGAYICIAFIGPCTSPRCRIPGVHASHGTVGCMKLAEKAGITVAQIIDPRLKGIDLP